MSSYRDNIKEQHKIRINHLKLQSMGYNMFRKMQQMTIFIEPLYMMDDNYIHRPDIVAIEERNKRMYLHWMEVKGNFSKPNFLIKEILGNYDNIIKNKTQITRYLKENYSLYKLNNVEKIIMDYNIIIHPILVNEIISKKKWYDNLNKKGIGIFSADYENDKMFFITNESENGPFWSMEFLRSIKNNNDSHKYKYPIVYSPTYFYSILFTDVIKYFTREFIYGDYMPDISRGIKHGEQLGILKIKESLKTRYNYPNYLAQIYADGTLRHLCDVDIFRKVKKKLGGRYKYFCLLDEKITNAFENVYINKFDFLIDYLTNKKIKVQEIKGVISRFIDVY